PGISRLARAACLPAGMVRFLEIHRLSPDRSLLMRRLQRVLSAIPLLALVAGTPLLAQMPGKEYLIGGFERQKGVLLQYVDAMPDSAWHFSPTPGVRNYAQQLEHIAQATSGLTRRVSGSTLAAPAFP